MQTKICYTYLRKILYMTTRQKNILIGLAILVGVLIFIGEVFVFQFGNKSGAPQSFVEQHVTLSDGRVETVLIAKEEYEATRQEEKELKRQAKEKQERELVQQKLEEEAENIRIFRDAWTADVRGYYEVRTVDCPSWESCRTTKRGYFLMPNTEYRDVRIYTEGEGPERRIFGMGCDTGSSLRYIPRMDVRSGQYQEFSGSGWEKLKKSSPEHPVMLRVTKPYDESYQSGTEGLVCMTPFSSFEIIEE